MLSFVDSPAKLDAMASSIAFNSRILQLDTETTSLHPKDGKLRLIQIGDGETEWVIDCFAFDNYQQLEKVKRILEDSERKKICHNAKFELMWLKHALGARMATFFDTFVANKLIDFKGNHKLSDIALKYLNVDLSKVEQKSDWSGVLTEAQIEYARNDVIHLERLREIQLEKLKETSQLSAALLEFNATPTIAEMEYRGFPVNYDKYSLFNENNKRTRDEKEKALLEFLQTRGGKRELPKRIQQEDIFGGLVDVKSTNDINVGSWQQVLPIYQEMGIPIASTDQKIIGPLVNEYPELKYLIEHREWAKLCSAFGDSLLEKIDSGRIYADMWQLGTITARLSCIASGQKISIPGGYRNIEDIEVGEHVYCYDDAGNLKIKRVLNKFYNGKRECVKLNWQNLSGGKGEVICTPEHQIKTKYKGWVRADSLKRYDKLFHLSRLLQNSTGRVRLYGTNGYMELEEQFLKREYFKEPSYKHIHHKDHVKSNNFLDNLEVMTREEHVRHHAMDLLSQGKIKTDHLRNHRPKVLYGEEHARWISKSKYELLRMLAKSGCRPTYISMDFDTFKGKCDLNGIDIKELSVRYNAKGRYVSKGKIIAAYRTFGNLSKMANSLCIGFRKLKKLLDIYDIDLNHTVYRLDENVGFYDVYDLEVEDCHNFIVNGICVHNCSNPNLQQLPSDKDCRSCFSAPEGRKLVIADYSTFELRILAEIADDAVMIDAFNSGKDLHSMTASKVFGIPYEEIMKEKKGIHKDKRDSAKMGNFAICYGINPIALMNRIKGAGVDCDEETAKKIIDGFYETYAGAKRWLFGQERKILQNKHLKGIGGHRITVDYIRGDKSSERSAGRDARNYPIQNCVRHDSLVLSKYEGLVPISSLVDKNDLELWDGDRFVNCEKVVFSGKKQNYKIRLMSGIEINCSPEHKFLTFNSHGTEKWRTAKEISELKQVYIKLTSEMTFHNEVTLEGFINSADRYKVTSSNSRDLSLISINDSRELGLFLGRVASDGQVDTTKVVCIVAEHEKSVLDDLSSILKDFPFKIRHANKSQQLKHPDYNSIYNLTICSRSLASELLACGIKKNIPIFAWSNRQLMSGYLSGLFDGDSHVSKDGITLTFGGDIDKKEPWAREVQLALLGFGIRSRVRKYYNPRNGSRVVVQIIAKDCARFSSEIGFMNPVKDKKVKHISPTHKYKSIDSNIYGFSDRVRSVEINEELVDMYDVINSETHRFMVNGVVSHNCNAVATKRAMKLITDKFYERGYSDDTFLVLSVHDELIAECPEKRAEEVKEIVQWGMESAGEEYIKKVKIVAEAAVCDNWSQKG